MQTCSLLDLSAALQPNLCKRSALLIIIDYQSSSSSQRSKGNIFSLPVPKTQGTIFSQNTK